MARGEAARSRRGRSLTVAPIEEAVVERIARIMGEDSGSARALAERHRRRAAGEDVALFQGAGMTIVGPPLAAPPPGGDGAAADGGVGWAGR